jgi:hypothetical protein
MIHRYSLEQQRLWDRGDHQVQIDVPGQMRPMGYCDGSEADEAELRAIGEEEGVDDLPIQKRHLKTGRQIWTVGAPPSDDEADEG